MIAGGKVEGGGRRGKGEVGGGRGDGEGPKKDFDYSFYTTFSLSTSVHHTPFNPLYNYAASPRF